MSELNYEARSSAPAAGWYPDPAEPGATRWWSGESWTDHVERAAVAAVPSAAVPVATPVPVLAPSLSPSMSPEFSPALSPAVSPAVSPALAPTGAASSAPAVSPFTPAGAPSNYDSAGVPLSLFADSGVSPAVFTPAVKPATQSDWHNQTGRGVVPKRQVSGSVSLSTGVPTAASRKHDPYRERNWIAGLALVLALLSIPALGARVLISDLPPLTQSIFAGAPIAVALLALVVSIRRGSGIVVSIIAVVISGGVLAASLLVDPAILHDLASSVVDLLP